MAEPGEMTAWPVSSILSDLDAAQKRYDRTIDEAAALVARAKVLQTDAPFDLDTARQAAATKLFELAAADPRQISERDILLAVLRISQGEISYPEIDEAGILDRFDALSTGAPALLSGPDDVPDIPVVITSHPIKVQLTRRFNDRSVKAKVGFGFNRITGGDEDPTLEVETIYELPDIGLAAQTIGREAVQARIDAIEFVSNSSAHKEDDRNNADEIVTLAHSVTKLAVVTGTDFDTTHLNKVVETAERSERFRKRRIKGQRAMRNSMVYRHGQFGAMPSKKY